ncbi:hypothetical protein [Streptomyces lancefieldiae]|uniref:Uncharacterized protein n=1 Tax=Streptomyces lancefieldiae TaxID=3075520 RepID=A0ABU3ALZ5_9ACTN|nr:hypothetical protein [Streptomyces sp. DSM 40712]MDT0610875.1 hypothetical protein [Streptomyces sp. DSM 40712]
MAQEYPAIHSWQASNENRQVLDIREKPLFTGVMIHHTMIVAFDDPIPADVLDQYLKELEELVTGSGVVESFAARHHIRVPGDDHSPVAVASAVVQLRLADLDALNATFTMPGAVDLIRRWQGRCPYKAIWVNHEPLS